MYCGEMHCILTAKTLTIENIITKSNNHNCRDSTYMKKYLPMKVLHVVTSMDPKGGGVSQAIRSIIASISAFGIHNEIVCLDRHDAPHLLNSDIIMRSIVAVVPGNTTVDLKIGYMPT
jgi:hypothetical protein